MSKFRLIPKNHHLNSVAAPLSWLPRFEPNTSQSWNVNKRVIEINWAGLVSNQSEHSLCLYVQRAIGLWLFEPRTQFYGLSQLLKQFHMSASSRQIIMWNLWFHSPNAERATRRPFIRQRPAREEIRRRLASSCQMLHGRVYTNKSHGLFVYIFSVIIKTAHAWIRSQSLRPLIKIHFKRKNTKL